MKINKKLIICLVIIFIIFNIYFYSQVNAGVLVNNILSKTQSASLSFNLPGPITTFLHNLLAALQVGVTGWFVKRFTCYRMVCNMVYMYWYTIFYCNCSFREGCKKR